MLNKILDNTREELAEVGLVIPTKLRNALRLTRDGFQRNIYTILYTMNDTTETRKLRPTKFEFRFNYRQR